VPGAATTLLKGNPLIQKYVAAANVIQFQISLMKLQMSMEKIFIEIA